MNQKTTYEQLITEKLEGIPVPDMADAIWARIENQLDIDMPTDDGGTDPDPKSPSGGGWVGGAGLFVFVAALISIFLINKSQKKRNQFIPPVQNVQRADSIQINNNFQSNPDSSLLFKRNSQQVTTSGVPFNTTPVVSGNVVNKDTTEVIPPPVTFEPFKPDSIQKVTTFTPPPAKLDTVQPKRPRGVSGITDNDYRIVPAARDSTKGQ